MSKPSEHKTVQARILACAEAIRLRQGYDGQIGWSIVSREEAEEKRGAISAHLPRNDGDRNIPAPLSLFFDDLLDAKVLGMLQKAGHLSIGEKDAVSYHL